MTPNSFCWWNENGSW